MTKDNTFVQGRSWEVAREGEVFMTCFDAFGNRDYYDYYIWKGREQLKHLVKTPEDKALRVFKAVLRGGTYDGQGPKKEAS